MFSKDIAKVRRAELKAKGDGGTIQRLRKCCEDAAAVMEHTAHLVTENRMQKKHRAELSASLLRGARLLRDMAGFSAPAGAFAVGERVRPSKKGLSANLWPPNRPVRTGGIPKGGVVVGIETPLSVRVLWDGRKTATAYHVDFIEPEPAK